MDGTAVDVPECFAWARDGRFGGSKRIEPGAVDARYIAVGAGYGSDKSRQAANVGAVPVEQSGVETEGRETAMVNRPGPEIGLGVSAVYGTATPPKAARCFHPVVGAGAIGDGHCRHGKEGAGLGEGGAKRAQAGGDADQVEEIAVLGGGGIGPLSRNARRRDADEERAPLGAANVSSGPIAALFAAVGEVSPADLLGAIAKSGGDGGGRAHGTGLAIKKRLGRGAGIGSIGDLSQGCRGRSGRGLSPPLGGAGSTAGARIAHRAVRPASARAELQKKWPAPCR